MKTIGIIGAGIMATGMAQNFLKKNHEVFVWNRTVDHLDTVVDAGAQLCDSPRAVAGKADIVIECVSDDDASRSVWHGERGILAGADNSKILMTSASLSLDWTDELALVCSDKGLRFLDMPLTGSRAGAENGTLKLMIGGDPATLDEIRPELAAIAEKVYHFGPAGSGMRFKLLLNSLIAIHMDAAAQAAELARRAGIDPEAFRHALFDGAMGPASPATDLLLQSLDKCEDHLNFSLKWMEKDLRYAKSMAAKYDASFNMLHAAYADFLQAKNIGLADRDLTAIAELYKGHER